MREQALHQIRTVFPQAGESTIEHFWNGVVAVTVDWLPRAAELGEKLGEAMDRAKDNWARVLNIAPSELTVGPSTSMNSYVMAQALGAHWGTATAPM